MNDFENNPGFKRLEEASSLIREAVRILEININDPETDDDIRQCSVAMKAYLQNKRAVHLHLGEQPFRMGN